MEKTRGIYKIECKANGKVYMGESNDIEKRWEVHIEDLSSNKHHSYKLQRDWNTYGKNNFTFDIVEEVKNQQTQYKTTMQLIYVEGTYINKYNSITNGYNIENTVEKVLSGARVILSAKVDSIYLKRLIAFNGVLPNKKPKELKPKAKINIKSTVVVNTTPKKKKLNTMLNCVSIVEELIADGYIIDFSRSGLYKVLEFKNIFKHENNSFYINEKYISDGYFINGKENINQQGYKYNQILITENGKEFIISLLNLKKR